MGTHRRWLLRGEPGGIVGAQTGEYIVNTEKRYLDLLEDVAREDVAVLQKKDREYGGSWKKRGGTGAFMMMARKWDRIEEQVRKSIGGEGIIRVPSYDIFAHAENDTRPEGLLDDIDDLRRYLLLVRAELTARRQGRPPMEHAPFGYEADG